MEPTPKPETQGLMTTLESSDSTEVKARATFPTAQSLRQSTPSLMRRFGAPAALLLIPIAYIVLISMIVYLHNKEQSSFGDAVIETLRIASSLWPVTFAAVLGPSLKSIALLKAERGTALASLEFLLASQTTATAILNLMTLKRIKELAALVIAAVWILGPLGGQAVLRSIDIHQNLITTQAPALYYLGNNQRRAHTIAGTRNIISAAFSNPDILVSHANGGSPSFDNAIKELGDKLQASRFGYRDLWRNVRVPFLEYLPGYDSDNPTSWVSVPLDQVIPYVSLIGLPIRVWPFDGAGNLTMAVQFHYQTLTCGEDFDGASWVKNGSTSLFYHETTSPVPLHLQCYKPGTAISYPNIWLDIANTSTARQQLNLTRNVQLEAQSTLQLVMGGRCQVRSRVDEFDDITRLRLGDISISYIEMVIECNRITQDADLICQVARIRRAPSHPSQGNLTALSSWRMAYSILMGIPFTGASEHPSNRAPSTVEAYLRDPANALKRDLDPLDDITGYRYLQGCYSLVPAKVIERRLAMVLNTFIMAFHNLTALIGGDGVIIEDAQFPWKRSTSTWTQFAKKIYVVDRLWFSITVLSTAALVVSAVANVIIRLQIRAPDFLTSVAGLTRDTSFVDVWNQVGSGMGGADCLKVLGDVQVQIRDVYPDRDVGRIALTTDLTQQKLKLDRNYE